MLFRRSIEIVRGRLPEVLLIVFLNWAGLFLFNELYELMAEGAVDPEQSQLPVFLLSAGSVLFSVLWLMVFTGFLRSVLFGPDQPSGVGDLLRFSKGFFWRMVRYQLLISILFMLLLQIGLVISGAAESPVPDNPSYSDIHKIQLASFIAAVILIKPALLCPAIMLVEDKMVFASLGNLSRYRLAIFTGPAMFYVLKIAVAYIGGWYLLKIPDGPMRYTAFGAEYAVTSFLNFFTALYTLITLACVSGYFERENEQYDQSEEAEDERI